MNTRAYAVAGGLVLLLGLLPSSGACAAQSAVETAQVQRVDDGDTLRIAIDGRTVRVRIFAIDAPELDQPYGREALAEARRLLAGRVVAVTRRDTDPYGRLVASLAIDGRDVGRDLVAAGAAWHFTQFSDSRVLAAAEREARAERRGLWAFSNPVAPWRHRAEGRSNEASAAGRPTVPGDFHGNVSSRVFHAKECPQFGCPNCTAGFASADAARQAGYRPHRACVR